jgi:[ribosomal protein S5]-alanine N-acetyltransferase
MHFINQSVFNTFPVLKTNRLTLRAITKDDATEIFKMRANGRVNQFIARNNMEDRENAVKLVESVNLAYKNKQAIAWAGILRDNKAIIGTCGFNNIDIPNLHAEIGGELSVDYWGKHIAAEAVEAILKFGLETMNLHTIEAKVSPDNKGAIFLLEQLGFTKEAHYADRVYFNEKFSDMAVYTLLSGTQTFG